MQFTAAALPYVCLGIALPCSNDVPCLRRALSIFANVIYHFQQIGFKTQSTGTLERAIAGRSNNKHGKPALPGRTS
jgi:hypothetical protein